MLELLQLSPPVGIKARKYRSYEKTMLYNKKDIENMKTFDIDNPMWEAYAQLVEGATNVPVARLHRKVENLQAALDTENEWWQRLAVALGWSKWDVGIEKSSKIKKAKDKESRDTSKEEENRKKDDGRCVAISRSGNRCKNKAESGGYCTIHAKVEKRTDGKKTQCTKIKSDGKRCKMKTSAKSDRCYYHD